MKDKGVGDTEAFNKVAGEIGKAIKNVNTSIKEVKDISSTESKATFSLGSDLRKQIKTATEDPDSNLDAIKFSDEASVVEATTEKTTTLLGNSTDYFGAVIKGPLEQALVFLDYNNDGNWNPGEPKTRTDADGKFEIKNARSDMSFTVFTDEQTVDNSSGQVLEGVVFKAPLRGALKTTPSKT